MILVSDHSSSGEPLVVVESTATNDIVASGVSRFRYIDNLAKIAFDGSPVGANVTFRNLLVGTLASSMAPLPPLASKLKVTSSGGQ